MSSKANNEPADSLQDNMIHDIGDSMLTGMAAHMLISYAVSRKCKRRPEIWRDDRCL